MFWLGFAAGAGAVILVAGAWLLYQFSKAETWW